MAKLRIILIDEGSDVYSDNRNKQYEIATLEDYSVGDSESNDIIHRLRKTLNQISEERSDEWWNS